MAVAHSNYILEKVKGLSEDLKQAILNGDLKLTGLTIRLLAVLEPELREIENLTKDISFLEGRKARKWDFLSEIEIKIMLFIFGLDGKKKLSFTETVQELYPELKNSSESVGNTKQYGTLRYYFGTALKKIRLVLENGINISSLPEDNIKFYESLRDRYPKANFNQICGRIILGYKKSDKNRRKAGEAEDKFFRHPEGKRNPASNPENSEKPSTNNISL